MKTLALLAIGFMLLASTPARADEPLEFTSRSSPGYQHALAAMLEESGIATLDLVAAEADFNDDGRIDVMAFALSSYFCGSGGCGPRIYLAGKKGGWRQIELYGLGQPENWYLLDSSHNGFRKLAMLDDQGELIFVWDGSAYVLDE